MADQTWTATHHLIDELLRKPHQFDFYQAVNILLAAKPEALPPGRIGPTEQEPVRFRSHASLAFPSCDVERVERLQNQGGSGPAYRMTVNFMGLYGSVSPLPVFYTEDLIAGNEEESNQRDFLDLFNHRMISLVYRSWEKYRYYIQFQPDATDRFSQWMYALVGLGGKVQREGLQLDWERLLAYIGLFSMRSRSALTLARIISHYFKGLPVAIQQCVERWVVIDHTQHARLGKHNCSLARDCTIGERVRDRSGKFRLCIGALDFTLFRRYLPDGPDYRPLLDLVRFSLRDQLEFDIRLTLMQDEVPDLDLAADNPCRLGWSTWLGFHPDQDADVILDYAGLYPRNRLHTE
jgi:type VI secretion system protein ImpH